MTIAPCEGPFRACMTRRIVQTHGTHSLSLRVAPVAPRASAAECARMRKSYTQGRRVRAMVVGLAMGGSGGVLNGVVVRVPMLKVRTALQPLP